MGELLSGELLDGKYLIEKILGQGGMGAVYRATHLGTTRTVAVKIIHPRFSEDLEFVDRFRREAEAAGRLRHPNVVDVTDFGFAQTRSGRVAYLVMEYLDGRSLGQVLEEEGRLSVGWVVDILEQVCSAVSEAHRAGILHRDLKPDNIWLEPNRRGGYTVKVLDFGLAKLSEFEPAVPQHMPPWTPGANDVTGAFPVADSGALTQAGLVLGTPLYMAPEQCRGEKLDARSDIYSLGIVAYHMLAGQPPFVGDAAALVRQHCDAAPPAFAERGVKVARRIAAVVMSALAKRPADRPESATGFAAALRAAAEGSGTLLRHAVSLYSEHFPTFFRLSLMAYVPLILLAGVVVWIDRDTPDGTTSSPGALLIFLSFIASNLFAYAAVTAGTVPLVVQLTLAPLRQVNVGTALDALKLRGFAFAASTAAVMAMTFVGLVCLIAPGVAVAVWHILYAPVAVMERLTVRATLKRSRLLIRRVWSTALVIVVLQFTLPALVWIASIDSTFVLRFDDAWQPREIRFSFGMSARSMLYQLLNIVVTPLTATMTAQLYLKGRYAGGEILSTIGGTD